MIENTNIKDLLKKLNKKMQDVLPAKRYNHSVGVSYTAASLAMKYEVDINSALIAGLLHDCAKAYTGEELLSFCKKHGIKPSDVETQNAELLHAKVGSVLAKEKYKIDDTDILNAIKWHTTGRPDMTILEKIVFVADYIEPSRKMIPNLNQIRSLAFSDIDRCIVAITMATIEYLNSKNACLDDMTQETHDYYINLIGD